MTARIPARTRYQGLAQIFDYNRPFYLRTAAGAIVTILLSVYVPPAIRIWIAFGTGIALFWTCSSLLVSHYVYDRSCLYRLGWLRGCLSRPPGRWINIHAGVDETSLAIYSIFPGSEGQIIDIYDPRKMTETSIRRARHIAGFSSSAADRQGLPAPDDDFDAVFLIFAAHELRRHEDRVQLFREVTRVLRREGELVLLEHLRDWANFLAFGPGFLHFFSKRAWATAANSAGLRIGLHSTVTPFVHVFVLQKSE
ncbi:MAG TPA: methyltransferase domain-containing protein [Bryobacteraceae bacterium]|jgi:SAM-dependent methyltransferase